jgi:Leu/Phe-tRNA-protein transferase
MWTLIERLRANGHRFIDTQQAKGLGRKWGAELVSRDQFTDMLRDAQAANLPF